MTRARHVLRQGFTLIELLVASGVFLIGFVAVFGLFLAGVRFRKLSDDTARSALAASSLINEIRIDAGREASLTSPPPVPVAPSAYVGDGFATGPAEGPALPPVTIPAGPASTDPASDFELFSYPAQPGVWYRVLTCTDFVGTDQSDTTALRLRLLVLPWSQAEDPNDFDLDMVNKRIGILPPRSSIPTGQAMVDELLKRGLAFEYHATIIRHPSWR